MAAKANPPISVAPKPIPMTTAPPAAQPVLPMLFLGGTNISFIFKQITSSIWREVREREREREREMCTVDTQYRIYAYIYEKYIYPVIYYVYNICCRQFRFRTHLSSFSCVHWPWLDSKVGNPALRLCRREICEGMKDQLLRAKRGGLRCSRRRSRTAT